MDVSLAPAGTRQRIFDAALRRFLLDGHGDVSMRRIARDVGITPMAIYRHFADKQALQCALIEAGFVIFAKYLRRSLKAPTPREKLLMMADEFMAFAMENSAYFELLFLTGQAAAGLKNRDAVLDVSRPAFDILHDCTRDYLVSIGELEAGSLDFAQWLLATSIGYAALHISGTFGWSEGEASAALRQTIEEMI